ncbi:DUF2855 family protein [soil metagenome]
MAAWDLLVDRKDLRKAQIVPAPAPPLADGEVRLAVERFSFTANNVTYGLMGDSFGYWKFFPAPEGQGRIPVWGFATVTESRAPDVPVGLRLFGYLPMSTSFLMQLQKGRTGFVDRAPHRAELPPTYNAYNEAPADPLDDHRALLRPLLMTSFLLDDFLGEDEALTSLALSSASSKTALGLAWFAKAHGREVIGLTSSANAKSIEGLGLYDKVLTYDQVGALTTKGPAAFVDFAGDRATTAKVHAALGEALTRSIIVGATHWEAGREDSAIPGPTPTLFFAPDQIRKRMSDWGPGEVETRFDKGLRAFVADSPWLDLVQHHGQQGLTDAYHMVLEGRVRPQDGHIITPA